MGFLRNRLFGRSSKLSLLSDIAMVGAAAARVIRRPSASSSGLTGAAQKAKPGEIVLVAGAALRLLSRIRRVRRNRKRSATAEA